MSLREQRCEPGNLGLVGDNVLGDAICEIFLFRIATHIGEGEHRDRRLLLCSLGRVRLATGRYDSCSATYLLFLRRMS